MNHKIVVFAAMLLALLPLGGYAQQTITLDQAIASALEGDHRLETADAAIERTRAMRGESWELAPMEFELARGQLNGHERKDQQLNITQSIGSLLTPFYKNALIRKQLTTGTYHKELIRREIIAEVKQAWSYYLYTRELYRLYNDHYTLTVELLHADGEPAEQEKSSSLERGMAATLAAEIHNKLFQAEQEHQAAQMRLQWVCGADEQIVVADTQMEQFAVPVAGELSSDYRGYFESQADEAQAQVQVEKSRFFPEISLGYQRQHMLPDKGLDAYVVGASFPIFFNSHRSRIRQAKADAFIARSESEASISDMENRLTELRSGILRYDQRIDRYRSSALPEAQGLVTMIRAQLQDDQANIAALIQGLNSILEIRRGYIEALYRYNIAVLEYELYQ